MNCFNCDTNLSDISQLFFYYKNDKSVELTIKPEVEILFEEEKTLRIFYDSDKTRYLICSNCRFIVGMIFPFAPNNRDLKVFSCDRVKLGQKLYSGKKWHNIYKTLAIENRNTEAFFKDSSLIQNPRRSVNKKVIEETVHFPLVAKRENFEWFTVSLVKSPRDYQIEAYVQGLLKNTVIVLNTGAGKTLIASMILAKMCKLNPSRMGLMIVDRVPLVFQQGDAVAEDTNLSVVSVCGENKTINTLNKINRAFYDILVVTAGAFNGMLEDHYVDVSLFSTVIFDECHHLTGKHVYTDVMRKFMCQKVTHQPRFIGLTASPFAANNDQQGEKGLRKFLANFPNAGICSPKLELNHQKMIKKLVSVSQNQQRFIKITVSRINKYLKRIAKVCDRQNQNLLLELDLRNSYRIIGDLRSMQRQYPEKENNKDFRYAFLLMEALELAIYFGIPSACKLLKDEAVLGDIRKDFNGVTEISERLQTLDLYIKNAKEDSRMLVFVNKRSTARFLTSYIQKHFPELNPQMVVGHSGYDGMVWEAQQQKCIKEFAGGDSRLIVSTSVLEEGIDVGLCDTVVAFTGLQSLIGFIQIRGRARKYDSTFVIFETEEETVVHEKAEKQEKVMRRVLNKHVQSDLSELSKKIVEDIKGEIKSTGSDTGGNSFSELSIIPTKENKIAFKLYIDPLEQYNSHKLMDHVRMNVEKMNFFVLKRFELVSLKENFISNDVFSSNTQMFIVYISSITQSISPSALYRRFVCSFDYRIKITEKIYQVWSNIELKEAEVLSEAQKMNCRKFSLGYFKNRSTVVIGRKFEQEGEISFNPRKSIDIKLFDNIVIKIEINFVTMSKFSFLSINRDGITLHINLSQVPLFSKFDSIERKWTRVYQGEIQSYFANYPLLLLTFNPQDYLNLHKIFHSSTLYPVSILHTKLDLCNDRCNFHSGKTVPWSMKCIIDHRRVCFPPGTREQILNDIDKKCKTHDSRIVNSLCKSILSKLSQTIYRYFTDLFQEFENIFTIAINTPLMDGNLVNTVRLKNVFYIKRVTVTPTRVISLPEVLVPSNRFLMEMEKQIEDVIIVLFRDDDTTKITDKSIVDRFQDILVNFLEIENKKYRYFLSTKSQMRNHKAYFIRSETWDEVLELRKRFVPRPEYFSSVAKYISRLGMYGTATAFIFNISMDSINYSDDIKVENGDLTTDGAGLISLSKAKEIARSLELDETPSAFQIRYSGFKGVISCTCDDDLQLEGKNFLIRKSMRKFENEDQKFCVTNYSKYHKVHLNREIINLLSSIEDYNIKDVLIRYMDKDLEELISMFENEEIALRNLKRYLSQSNALFIFDRRFTFTENAHWFEVLKGIYRLRSMELKNKMNITIEEGAFLVGIPDPYGVLKDNEVFVQVHKNDSAGRKIIQKRAFIYRNPCLHPGDHRIVECVDKEKLRHLYNVLVLPTWNCKSSLAAECSGGDLDGDHFSVIWDENLVPPKNFPSCQYSELVNKDENHQGENVNSVSLIANFFTDFLTNDILGRTAHMHLALCDIQDKGAHDDLAIELAKYQAQAIDYAKTGIKLEIPTRAIDIVSTKGFPDFMEKKFEESYQSQKILGELYRHCKEIVVEYESNREDQLNLSDEFMKIDGFQEYLEEAQSVYEFYKYHVKMIMVKYQLRSEIDVILASATYGWDEKIDENKGKISEIIKEWYEYISKTCRELFFSNVEDEKEKQRKVYAWYYVAYNKKSRHDKVNFLGFPWIVADCLLKIRKKKEQDNSSKVNYVIGKSCALCFKQKHYRTLFHDTSEKLNYVGRIERAMNQFTKEHYQVSKGFNVQSYGSTSLYVNEPESDLDICARATDDLYNSPVVKEKEKFLKLPQDKQQLHFLGIILSRVADSLASKKTDYFNLKPPFIKFQSSDLDENISCDISMNVNGLSKTYYFQYLFKKDWIYFMVLWSLVKWARAAELIRPFATAEKREIDTADFYALIVYTLNFPKAPPVDATKPIPTIKLSKIYKNILKSHKQGQSRKQFHIVGEMILSFFKKVSRACDSVTIEWSKEYGLDSVEDVIVKAETMRNISLKAIKALHCLSTLQDFESMLMYFMKSEDFTQFMKNLPTSLSLAIGKAKEFHRTLLEVNTGASVRIDTTDSKKNYRVVAKGTRAQLNQLRKEIRSLMANNRALVLGRLPLANSRYFIEGSSKLFSLQQTECDSRVKFEVSQACCAPFHDLRERVSVILQDPDEEYIEEYEIQQYDKFKAHIMQQMSLFPVEKKELLASLVVSVRFGSFYLMDVSSSLPSASISFQELQIAQEKGRRARKNWETRNFTINKEEYEAKTKKTTKHSESEK